MKQLLTTLAVTSLLVLPACNKTKKAVAKNQTATSEKELDVQVEVDGTEVVLMINGEEQNIDMSKLLSSGALTNMNGDVSVFVVDTEIGDEEHGAWVLDMPEGNVKFESHIVVNGEEVDGLPEGVMQRVMQMIANGEDSDMDIDVSYGWSEVMPEHGNMHATKIIRGLGHEESGEDRGMRERIMHMTESGMDSCPMMNGEHEGMREHMMHMMESGMDSCPMMNGEHEGMREHMMHMMHTMAGDMDGNHRMNGEHNEHGDMREHRGMEGHAHRDNDRDEPEEIQFIQELGLLGEVSEYLEQNDSVALKGIQMIRDELDGDIRLAALEVIIAEALEGSSARNAALFVAIQTLQEEGDDEGASEYMIELVLSN
jgi:hypothetical protein